MAQVLAIPPTCTVWASQKLSKRCSDGIFSSKARISIFDAVAADDPKRAPC